jgi:uncharacterized membrane protein YdjX (TVP38/TMEM64 family)
MKRYAIVATIIAVLILVSFLVVEAIGIPLLTDPSDDIRGGGWLAAAIGSGLLLADVFIPIPSSVIMIAHGAAFGVLGGFLLSLLASVGGAMIGWWVGNRGSPLIDRIVSPRERRQANAFILRYGLLAIIISRLLPIVAETVAIMAGTTDIGWRRMLVATSIGAVPPALIYAIAGSATTDFASGALVTVGVVVLAIAAWTAGRRLMPGDAAAVDPATATIEEQRAA